MNDIDNHTYELAPDGNSIKCLRCDRTSYNPSDVSQLFCGHCGEFHTYGNPQPETTEYSKQCCLMRERALAWIARNPGANPKIQFNFTPHTAVIASISLAIAEHIVSVDDAGFELIKAMGDLGESREPTVLMVQAVMESLNSAVPTAKCPACGYRHDTATSLLHGTAPDEGDVSICINCGAANIFDARLHPRTATPEELIDIQQHPVLWEKIQEAQRFIRARVRRDNQSPQST